MVTNLVSKLARGELLNTSNSLLTEKHPSRAALSGDLARKWQTVVIGIQVTDHV